MDASALVAYLTGTQGAARVAEKLLGGPGPLAAPHLVDAEVGQVLRREVRTKRMSERDAMTLVHELGRLPVDRFGHGLLMARAWELRNNLSFYDALYVALAELLDTPLVTLDARIAGAPGVTAQVEVIS